MADTDSSKEATSEEVALTNVSRRPLLMRLPGKTLRLGPGEQQTVPKSLLATTELLRMCEQRFVVVSPISEPKVEASPARMEVTTAPSSVTPDAPGVVENQPEVEAADAEGTESDSTDLKPEIPAEVEDTPQSNVKERKPTKAKN